MGIEEMAEIRCPMCSKLNPEDAEVCAYCEARLKPLVMDSPIEEAPTGRVEDERATQDRDAEEVPDWLNRIRAQAEKEKDESPEPGEAEAEPEPPDWLGRLRTAEDDEEGPPSDEIPEWLSEFEEAGEEEDEGEAEEVLEEIEEPVAEEVDWISRIRESEPAPEPEPEREEPEPAAPADDDWLSRLREDGEEEQPLLAESVEFEKEDVESEQAIVLPFEDVEPEADTGLEAEPQDLDIDIPALEDLRPMEDEAEPEAELPQETIPFDELGEEEALPPSEEASAEEVIDWEQLEASLDFEEDMEVGEEDFEIEEIAPGIIDLPVPEEDAAEEAPPAAEVAEGIPEWIQDARPPSDGEYPHVPALLLEEEEPEPSEEGPDIGLEEIELPGWLNELRETSADEEVPIVEAPPDLAPATLPSWLEAMRPVETFRSTVEIESVEDQVVESAGPLAGLRGVLMAEPVVALPRSVSVGAAHLNVTERQFAQSEILNRMITEEDQERPKAAIKRARIPILRWAISLVLLLAVALPIFTPDAATGRFTIPSFAPRELGPVYTLVDRLPTEQPALIVFDYPPGYSGEMDAVAGALIRQLTAHKLNLVTISTSPTGPPLATRLIEQVNAAEAGHLNLGYLSGGSTAIQLFAAAPREAVLRGFRLPEEMEAKPVWESPILEDVYRLSDFGIIAVITAGSETARTWAEQVTPWVGETPVVMVLSAGIEPLVRPYYESLEPQVDGLLTGLPAAVAYEQLNGHAAAAYARWDAFGSGLIAVELVLVAGVIYGVVTWFLRSKDE
jgi:hypothetical protein